MQVQYTYANKLCIELIFDVGIAQPWATGWMIEDSSPGKGWEFFSSPPCPERNCGPHSLLSKG